MFSKSMFIEIHRKKLGFKKKKNELSICVKDNFSQNLYVDSARAP